MTPLSTAAWNDAIMGPPESDITDFVQYTVQWNSYSINGHIPRLAKKERPVITRRSEYAVYSMILTHDNQPCLRCTDVDTQYCYWGWSIPSFVLSFFFHSTFPPIFALASPARKQAWSTWSFSTFRSVCSQYSRSNIFSPKSDPI